MAEGAVPDIVAQSNGLDEVLVQRQQAAACSRDLGDKLDVEPAVGDVIILDQVEHLGFVDVARISVGVKDAVGIQSTASLTLF